jgi:hypothetical protein
MLCHSPQLTCVHHQTNHVSNSPAHCLLYLPNTKGYSTSLFTSYEPPNINSSTFVANEPSKSEYVQAKSKQKSPYLSELRSQSYQELSVMDQLLKFLITQKLSCLTFACFCTNNSNMIYVLEMLVKNGLTPVVTNSHNVIMSLSLHSINVRFINLLNFLPYKTVYDLGVNSFFPLNFINRANYANNLVPNSPEYFISLDDTKGTVDKKRNYFFSIYQAKDWNFARNLLKYNMQIVIALINSTHTFLGECHFFQGMVHALTQSLHYPFYHPLHDNSTKTGYIYKLYQAYILNTYNIYAVQKEHSGIYIKSSKGEYEYVSYYCYNNPNHTVVHAFSPFGQLKFQHSVPDGVDISNGHAIYYHGCYHHKHDCKKKFTQEESNFENEKFEKKVKDMMKSSKNRVTSYHVIWECEWTDLKKNSIEVQQFMSHQFRPRPMKRLVPRNACK